MKNLLNRYTSKMSTLQSAEPNLGKKIIKTKSSTKLETIKKTTHLYLHDKYLQNIENLSAYENLLVLYLHNNEIKTINNLQSLISLKHLYLQKNQLTKIEGLETLKNLRKLYLGCNGISVVEGLDKLTNLEELHVEKQQLHKGESLCFDPRSIINLSESLQILNISHNNLTTIESLEPLKNIKVLNASHNRICDAENVAKIVHNWYYLQELNFIGNPMTKQHRYRDILIANTFRLVILDDKDINETTRSFIKRFEHEKSQNRMNSASKYNIIPPNLPGSFPPGLQKAVTKTLAKNTRSKPLLTTSPSEETDVYLPWQALKPFLNDSGKAVPPLFAKHQRRKKPETKKVHFSIFPQLP